MNGIINVSYFKILAAQDDYLMRVFRLVHGVWPNSTIDGSHARSIDQLKAII